MKITNLFNILGLLSLLFLSNCEDGWTGEEVITTELTITNSDYVGCYGDSVQLWALDQNGDTTTNVNWFSGNGSVTVNSAGMATLGSIASAKIMARSVSDNITSNSISITSINPSPKDQIVGTWLASISNSDTIGMVAWGYKYQKLTINANGTWSGEVRTVLDDTSKGSGYFTLDTSSWLGTNMTWEARVSANEVFSTYCNSFDYDLNDGYYGDGTQPSADGSLITSDTCRVIETTWTFNDSIFDYEPAYDTTFVTNFSTYCSTLGDGDGTITDTLSVGAGGLVCSYSNLDTTQVAIDWNNWSYPDTTSDRAFFNSVCNISDTLGGLVSTWNSGKSVRQ